MKSPQEKSFKREEEGGRGSYEFLQFLTLPQRPKWVPKHSILLQTRPVLNKFQQCVIKVHNPIWKNCFESPTNYSFRSNTNKFTLTLNWVSAWSKVLIPTRHSQVSDWNFMPLLGDFGGRVGIYSFLQSPSIPRMLPSLFSCKDCFSLCPCNRVHASLQARGTLMSAGTWVEAQKDKKSLHLKREGSIQGIVQ